MNLTSGTSTSGCTEGVDFFPAPLENQTASSHSQFATGRLAVLQAGHLPRPIIVPCSTVLAYYRHSDWLGSSRLASTTSRTVYYDGAYGPFGEPYAGSGTTDLDFTGMNQTPHPTSTISPRVNTASRDAGPHPTPPASPPSIPWTLKPGTATPTSATPHSNRPTPLGWS